MTCIEMNDHTLQIKANEESRTAKLKQTPHHPYFALFPSAPPPQLITIPIHSPHTKDSLDLHVREPLIAIINGIIHIIMNGIHLMLLLLIRTASLRRIDRTSICRRTLHGRVVDVVARSLTAIPLEGMQQTEPVARLMHGRLALVIALHQPVGHRVRIDVAPIVEVNGGIFLAVGNIARQGAAAQDTADEISLEVQIERAIGSLAQRLFHVVVGGLVAHGPRVVGIPRHVDEVELDVVRLVGLVERVELR